MLGVVGESACSESYSNVVCDVVRKKVILAGLGLCVCRKGEHEIQTAHSQMGKRYLYEHRVTWCLLLILLNLTTEERREGQKWK